MTPAGWIFMACSLGFVVGLTVFCFRRVLAGPAANTRDAAPPRSDAGSRGN